MLLLCLHTFSDDFHLQVFSYTDNGLHDHRIGGFYIDVAHKGLIDLDLIERKFCQVGQ